MSNAVKLALGGLAAFALVILFLFVLMGDNVSALWASPERVNSSGPSAAETARRQYAYDLQKTLAGPNGVTVEAIGAGSTVLLVTSHRMSVNDFQKFDNDGGFKGELRQHGFTKAVLSTGGTDSWTVTP